MKKIASGKVREIYELDADRLLLVTSDRISAFDVVMNQPVPDRGRILCALTDFWLNEQLKDVSHHLVSSEVPEEAADLADAEGRCQVVRRADMVPVEFIVRAYLAGSGWKEYVDSRSLHGVALPGGMQLGSKLPEPLLTPSTKAELGEHDINLTWQRAADIIGTETMKEAEKLVLDVFERASSVADECGFILADTKFELGWIDGKLSLCDEVLTPDSSRYWPKTGWQLGETPPPFDKQLLRNWLERQDWPKTPPPPQLPKDLIVATRNRYVEVYEKLTDRRFADWPGVTSR